MDEPINNNSYLLVIIIMTLAIVFFGGYKKHNNFQIEYYPQNHQYLNSLTYFEKDLQKFNSANFDIMQITNEVDLSECLIPNIIDIFFVNIKQHSYFDIIKHFKTKISNFIVIYNHNIITEIQDNFTNINSANENLMLLLDSVKECNYNICKNFGYYYPINKKISTLDIYPIYNDSNYVINITIIIIKKSFWHN